MACNFGFKKDTDCSMCVAKSKMLISFAVTAQLICIFVFAYTVCWFSYVVAKLYEFKYEYCLCGFQAVKLSFL